MSVRRIYAVSLRQAFLLRHNWPRFANIFLWSTLDIVLWGFIANYLDRIGKAQLSFLTVLLGAVMLWNFLIRVQQGVMLPFFEDVWSHNFLNFFASPLRTWEYLLGLIVTGIGTSLAGLGTMLLLAWFLFAFNLFRLGFFLVPFLGILFIFGVALGIFTAGLVLRLGPSAEWLAWPLPFILSPFAGIFYPVSALPAYLQPVASVIPPSYVFEGMRGVISTGTLSYLRLLLGFGVAGCYLLLAALFFLHVYRVVLRNGLFTRFSAESM